MKKIFLALGLLFLLFPQGASAQSQRNPCFYNVGPSPTDGCTAVSSTKPLPVNATISGSVSGFTPAGTFATLTATNASASVALPSGTTVAVQNTGTTAVSCSLGIGSATAVASQIVIQASSTIFVAPGSNTFAACIDQTGSTSNLVVLAGGSGLGAGFGGGGSGSGGGAVTIADGADVALGSTTDTPATTPTDATAATTIALLKSLANSNTASVPAGTNVIGGVNQGTSPWVISGTVTATPTGTQAISAASGAIASGALASGSMVDLGAQADAVCGTSTGSCSLIALIKFLNSTPGAIDQTTPGTTNGVTIVPSSSSAIGITPVVSASGEASHVLKAGAGNAYSAYATNLTATQGFLVLINATSAPVDGAITPLACSPIAPNGVASINYSPGPPGVFSTGIVAVVSSAATCFTKTTGVITAFISGQVQ